MTTADAWRWVVCGPGRVFHPHQATNNQNLTPADLARDAGYVKIAKMILDYVRRSSDDM